MGEQAFARQMPERALCGPCEAIGIMPLRLVMNTVDYAHPDAADMIFSFRSDFFAFLLV